MIRARRWTTVAGRRPALAFAVLVGGVACVPAALTAPVALALAQSPASAGVPSPTPQASPSPSAPSGVATPSGAATVRLTLQKVGGDPPFVIAGQRIYLRGAVTPYVAGQAVRVSFYIEGRKVEVRTPAITAGGPAGTPSAGVFHVSFASRSAGLWQARVAHYATAQQAAFSARSPGVRIVNVDLGPGSGGWSVRALQTELAALHYVVPQSGVIDEGTANALIAYRKMTGLERIPYAGRQVFELLGRQIGGFGVRYRRDGRHVEADLTKQVLAEIEPGGLVRAIYDMSSGKPSTPTVIGHFQVYEKTPGFNSEGMFDSNYFIRGYAIHGYAEVPTYAASHGCLRVPIPDAPAIYEWVHTGTAVDVYDEYGGGSTYVRSNAGP